MGAAAYADLYQLIDADPILNRSDFFPSVLNTFETTDGKLPYISRGFFIYTNIALRETADRIGSITYTNLFRMLDEPGVRSIFDREERTYVGQSGYIIHSFVDLEANRAYFDSDEFIAWLKASARLPLHFPDSPGFQHTYLAEEIADMLNGEQLLHRFGFGDLNRFRMYRAVLGDIVAVGRPTMTGGQHEITINPSTRIGINANSQHIDAAWDFVRRLFLPDFPIEETNHMIPIRIDRYEELIAEKMTPIIENGVEVPVPLDPWYVSSELIEIFNAFDLKVYAMTAEEAAEIREIIDNASLMKQHVDEVIGNIINEETTAFFTGARTAEETARILQNRVQRVLDERG
jgi:hypothetical protein